MNFTEKQIAFIIKNKTVGKRGFVDIAILLEKQFKRKTSAFEVKECWEKYKESSQSPEHDVELLKTVARSRKSSSFSSKENRAILNLWNQREDILEAIKEAAKEISRVKQPVVKRKKAVGKPGITKELLLSDIHFGKKTETFNLDVCKKRLEEVVQATISEIERDSKEYNVDEIIVALLGDIIENYSMHVLESAKGCEFGNSRQVYEATLNLFKIVILPLSSLGIKMKVVCVTGNHDRDGVSRTYHNPGEENFTYIIYNTIKNFAEFSGLKNIQFIIPKDPWAVINVYGNTVLYEHYDNCKNPNRAGLESLMTKRASQLNINIDYMRGGHFHEPTSFKNGRIQINGCLTGNDSFASVLGFNSEASQTLNTFVNTKNRRYKMYKSFIILLE